MNKKVIKYSIIGAIVAGFAYLCWVVYRTANYNPFKIVDEDNKPADPEDERQYVDIESD